jgi:hypothetical protein
LPTSVIFKNSPKINFCSIGENSPNLVTMAISFSSTRYNLDSRRKESRWSQDPVCRAAEFVLKDQN